MDQICQCGHSECVVCSRVEPSNRNNRDMEARGFHHHSDSESESETDSEIERQKSYDKKSSKLRGATLSKKKKKLVKALEPVDEGRIDTEELKSNPTNVFILDVKTRSRKALAIKQRVKKDLTRLSVECGFAVELTCTAPKPGGGKRGDPLKLSLLDKHGERAKCSCRFKAIRCNCSNRESANIAIQVVPNAPKSGTILTPSSSRQLTNRQELGQSLVSPISGPNLLRVTEEIVPLEADPDELSEAMDIAHHGETEEIPSKSPQAFSACTEETSPPSPNFSSPETGFTPSSRYQTSPYSTQSLQCSGSPLSHSERPSSPHSMSRPSSPHSMSRAPQLHPSPAPSQSSAPKSRSSAPKSGSSAPKSMQSAPQFNASAPQSKSCAPQSMNDSPRFTFAHSMFGGSQQRIVDSSLSSDRIRQLVSKPTFMPPTKEETSVIKGENTSVHKSKVPTCPLFLL